jgi:hypothetical protein
VAVTGVISVGREEVASEAEVRAEAAIVGIFVGSTAPIGCVFGVSLAVSKLGVAGGETPLQPTMITAEKQIMAVSLVIFPNIGLILSYYLTPV